MKTYKEFFAKSKDISENILIDTNLYESEHGSSPSGDGIWKFSDIQEGGGQTFSSTATKYKKASTQAKKWAKENGISTLYLMK